MIGDEDDALFLLLIPYLDTSQRVGIVLPRIVDVEDNQLILQDRAVSWNISFFDDRIVGIPFLSAHEPDTLLLPPGKEGIIHIAPVHDDNGSFWEGEILSNLHHFVGKSIGDLSEDREVTVVIKEQMELDSALGLTIAGPVKERDTQLDERSIQTEELILEAELFLSRGYHADLLEKLVEDCLIEPGGSFLVGIREGGTTGGGPIDPQMFEFAQTACKTSTDLT
jgi:hypothetical protein